jgi:hypothetical protein
MPFLEGMGDKQIPGAKKRGFARAGQEYNAEAREMGPGSTPVPDELPSAELDKPSLSGDKRGSVRGSWARIERGSSYGLPSMSELQYPEAYAPVSTVFWEGLTDQQRVEVMKLQALAQEKVGFERGTQKFFMEDFDPEEAQSSDPELRLVALAAPRMVFGGVLIGAGLTVAMLGIAGALLMAPALGFGLTAALAGAAMLVLSR